MTDTEVEQTLREIRERVRADQQARALARPADAASVSVEPASDARERLQANLATLERAWDRLPPVTSYRSGFAARVELWVKRQARRASRWFTWEQVNFNAAVLASLRDTLDALASYDQALRRLHAETDSRLAAFEDGTAPAFQELRAEVERTRDEQRERTTHLAEEQRVSFKQLSLEATEQAVAFDRARRALQTRLEELERRTS